MATVKKESTIYTKNEPRMTNTSDARVVALNPEDPNVRDPEHAHELGGTLGMTIGGVAGGVAAGVAAAASSGVIAGATLGAAAGPIGAVVGAAIGGAIGGVAGESIARSVNPTAEEEYWADNYVNRPYVIEGYDYEAYRPAYRYGVDAYAQNKGRSFDEVEPQLQNDWTKARGKSSLEWHEARDATRDAYDRLHGQRNN